MGNTLASAPDIEGIVKAINNFYCCRAGCTYQVRPTLNRKIFEVYNSVGALVVGSYVKMKTSNRQTRYYFINRA